MFGGYLGQEKDKQKMEALSNALKNDPDNEELRERFKEAHKYYRDRMDSAFKSYSRL